MQAGVIGTVLVKNQGGLVPDRVAEHERARHPLVGAGRAAAGAGAVRAGRAHCRYHRAARQLSGFDRRRRQGGLFRLQFGDKAMPKDEVASLISKLQGEKIVNLAVATP